MAKNAGRSAATSPLLAAAEAFDSELARFAGLAAGLGRVSLDSQRNLQRAGEMLKEIADCEEQLQVQAQALMAALGGARNAQQAQADLVRAQALEIQRRAEVFAAFMGRFEAIGADATALNASAKELAARDRSPAEMVKDGELLAGLDALEERMTAVASAGEGLATDARKADFEDLSSKVDSLRQQILAARNRIGLLKGQLVRGGPPGRPS
jgi:hypothetical protein